MQDTPYPLRMGRIGVQFFVTLWPRPWGRGRSSRNTLVPHMC